MSNDDVLWGEVPTEPAEPIAFTASRKDLLHVLTDSAGRFGIHRSEGKAILAFLASGPSDVTVDVAGGAWSISHDEGRLTGRLSPGTPPTWSSITDTRAPVLTFNLNGRYLSDAAKAAVGESGVVSLDWESAERPSVLRSPGYLEVVLPVRVGGGTAT